MSSMSKKMRPTAVRADPEQWSKQSKQSVAFGFRREYKDKPYHCWHCQSPSVFTAQDQRYTFEVLKASKDQNRILCRACWLDSIHIRTALRECEEQWSRSKVHLQLNKTFLVHWLGLLVALEKYVPGKPDTAKKNMLSKLLASA